MKNVNLLLIALITMFSFSIKAQTTNQQKATNDELKAKAEKGYLERQKSSTLKNGTQSSTQTNSSTVVIDDNDQYQGRANEFKRLFKSGEIPADFPKYNKSYGVRGYNQMIDYYASQHLDLLTDHVRVKISGK